MKHYISVFAILILSVTASHTQTTQQTSLNSQPSRAAGQPQLFPVSGAANRVEGRELWGPQYVALDTSGSTPVLYVADVFNNRVLAWKNATSFSNGATADLVIGQQDLLSTGAQGPGGALPTGFTGPTGLAVDSKGNLYVADSGNNRILRFPKPFNQPAPLTPDMWIGQPSLNSRTANYTGQVSASGLVLASSSSVFQAALAFDAAGNLWAADPGNVRVLRYPAANLSCTNCSASADIVIGQPNMNTVQTPALSNNAAGIVTSDRFGTLDGLAIDPKGRLFVMDNIGSGSGAVGRVLVFSNPSAQAGGLAADRIMGVVQQSDANSFTSQNDFLAFEGQTLMNNPSSAFFLPDNTIGIVDGGWNRILMFPPYEQWPDPHTHFSPQATGVVGQTSTALTNLNANGVQNGSGSVTPPAGAGTLWSPTSAVFLASTKELFVSDTGNNRVIVMPQFGTGFLPATRVLGQDRMDQSALNLIEGKEFNFFASGRYADAAIAIDTSGPTPHLWVSDPYNHRVLGFKDARQLSAASKADIVIGQPNLGTALCNYPTGSQTSPRASTLCLPFGIAVDGSGNLYVADSGNGRVLRFDNPFASGTVAFQNASLVLGQTSFNTSIQQLDNIHMGSPYGIAFSGQSGIVVSDAQYNRVVFIPFSSNGTFNPATDNGKPFAKVFGQLNFTSKNPGSSLSQMSQPHLIACDTSGQVYVTDTANNRVLIFGDPNNPQTGASGATAELVLTGLSQPRGIYVNAGTGEIWVANFGSNNSLVKYPNYDVLQFNATPVATIQNVVNNFLIPTIAVTQDQYGDLFVADADNRVSVYYQGLTAANAATFLSTAQRPLAPGMLATLFSLASPTQFVTAAQTAGGTTWPTSMGDIQVLFNGSPAPLYYVSPNQINFQVPIGAPTSGLVQIEVDQVSTGQVLAAQQLPMSTVAPGIYTSCQPNQAGTQREACVVNQDGTVNSSTNPAPRGSIISIYGNGQGIVSNAPQDGQPAPANPLATTLTSARVLMGTCFIDNCGPLQPGDVGTSGVQNPQWVPYSGLAPGFIGLWQVNAQIPMAIVPGQQKIAIVINNVASFDVNSGFQTYFYVK